MGALTSVAQLVAVHPVDQKFTGSISSQGTCLGSRFGPQSGANERQPIDVSLSHINVSLSPTPFSLNAVKKYPQVRIKKKIF